MIEENKGYFAVDELLKQVNDDHRRIDALEVAVKALGFRVSFENKKEEYTRQIQNLTVEDRDKILRDLDLWEQIIIKDPYRWGRWGFGLELELDLMMKGNSMRGKFDECESKGLSPFVDGTILYFINEFEEQAHRLRSVTVTDKPVMPAYLAIAKRDFLELCDEFKSMINIMRDVVSVFKTE
jgi:hypothetical protein